MRRLLCLIGLLLAVPAAAKPLYVNGATGNDATPYAQNDAAHPWRTIGRAAWGSANRATPVPAEAAQPGDVVTIAAGTYATAGQNGRFAVAYNPANSGTAGAPIVFRAEGRVVLQLSSGRGPVIGSDGRNYITWDGFTIDEAQAPPAQDTGSVTVFGARGVVLRGLDITGVIAPWDDNHNGIRLEQATGAIVTQSRIRGIGSQSGYGQNDAAVMLYDSNDTVIEHNDLIDSGLGVFVKGQHDGQTQRRTVIRWNRITGMRSQGLTIGPAARDGRTYQNLISGCAATAPAIRVFDFGTGEGREPVNELIAQNTITGCGGLYIQGVGQSVVVRGNVLDARGTALHPVMAIPASVAGMTFDANVYLGTWAAQVDADGSGRRLTLAEWRATDPAAAGAMPGDVLDTLDLDGDGATTDRIPAGAVVTGQEVIGRGEVIDPPPPTPVDCVGTWGAWTVTASSCTAGTRTITEARLFTVITPAANGGAACPASPETRTRTEPCDTPPPPPSTTLTATIAARTCTLTLASTPPSTLTGWGVQFQRRQGAGAWVSHGARDTAAPFSRAAAVDAGPWDTRAIWTRSGTPSVTVPGAAVSCVIDPPPAPVAGLPVPAERLAVANWRVAGMLDGGIPDRPSCAIVAPSTDDTRPALQAAIDACPVGQAVQLEAGRYPLTGFVLLSKGVTLRGRGAGVTILEKTDGATAGVLTSIDENAIVYGGPHRFPHWVNPGRDLTADATQGATSVSVADASGLQVGQHVEVGEDQFFTGAWRALPPVNGQPNPWQQWAGDRIAWPRFRRVDGAPDVRPGDYYGPGPIAPDSGPLTWHCRGYGYCLNEIKEIAAIDGQRVTFTTPLTTTYRLTHRAQLAVSDSPFVVGLGIEAMTLRRGARGAIQLANVARSWVRDVEIVEWAGSGIDILQSRQVEVTRANIHDAAWPYPGGGGYALGVKNGSTEILVRDSTMRKANKATAINAAGAGSVFAGNVIDDTYIGNFTEWVEVGLGADHFGGSHHVLFEGNTAHNADADDTHGTSWAVTWFRNTLTGRRSSFVDGSNRRAVGLMAGTRDATFLANTLGYAGMSGTEWTRWDGPTFTGAPAIWRIGYAPGEWRQDADPMTVATLIDLANVDLLTGTARTPFAGTLPASLYR